MKKFISLFAVAAILAFAGTAFAAQWQEKDVKSLVPDPTDPKNMGKVTVTAAPSRDSAPVNGAFAANVYYYGTVETGKKATAGLKLTNGTTTGGERTQFIYGVDFASAANFGVTVSLGGLAWQDIDLTDTAAVTYTVGVANSGHTAFDTGYVQAALTLTPVEVKFEPVADQTIKTGKAPADLTLALNRADLSLSVLGTPTIAITPADSGLTVNVAADGKITFTGTATKVGTYTVSVSSDSSGTFKIDEDGGPRGIAVANFPKAMTEVANFEIEVFDLIIDPQEVNWVIGKSDDVVSFDVDTIAFADFNGISTDIDGEYIITSQDKVSDPKSYVSSDAVISCDTTMVVSLDKTFLNDIADGLVGSRSPYVSIDETVKFCITAEDGKKSGTFSVRFTREATPQPPQPPHDNVIDVPADPKNSLLKETINVTGDADAEALVQANGLSVVGGAITQQAAVNAISANDIGIWGSNSAANVATLPIVSADIQDKGTIATIAFENVLGSTLVSDDANGRVVSANDLNIIKIVASDDAERLQRAGDVTGKTAEQLDGTFNVYRNDALVDTVNSRSRDYELRVYIADNGEYDLSPAAGNVVDPIAVVKSTGAAGSSSSSCDIGFGLVALAGLAALGAKTLRKRSK